MFGSSKKYFRFLSVLFLISTLLYSSASDANCPLNDDDPGGPANPFCDGPQSEADCPGQIFENNCGNFIDVETDENCYQEGCYWHCINYCVVPPNQCGNGVPQAQFGEECDDGNDDNTDACLDTCKNASCGDGFVWQGQEECDDGNPFNSDSCVGCVPATCGDGFVWQGQEECDDGNQNNNDNCTNNCKINIPAFCGDGNIDQNEECDDGNQNNNDNCLTTCQLSSCGDGFLHNQQDGEEECDEGVNNSDVLPNACRTSCKNPSCGDQVKDNGEDCDDGNLNENDSCLNSCQAAVCGDGKVYNQNGGTEECDDGVNNSNDLPNACRTNCKNAHCGDGVQDAGEGCDDQNNNNFDDCLNTCQQATCGDGILWNTGNGNELCDEGADNNDNLPDTCRTNCVPAYCGDNVVDTGETCDDGNSNDQDECPNNCQQAYCGDGILWNEQGGEEICDHGPDNSNTSPDACRLDCVPAHCGDGVVDTGEVCDDGNNINDDDCSNSCETVDHPPSRDERDYPFAIQSSLCADMATPKYHFPFDLPGRLVSHQEEYEEGEAQGEYLFSESGKYNQSLALNQSNFKFSSDLVNWASAGSVEFTFSVWIKTKKQDFSIFKRANGPNEPGFRFEMNNGHLVFHWVSDQEIQSIQSYGTYHGSDPDRTNLLDDQWHHVAISFSQKPEEKSRIFVDGIPINIDQDYYPEDEDFWYFDGSALAGKINSQAAFMLGDGYQSPHQNGEVDIPKFEGQIDQLLFYPQALSMESTAALYHRGCFAQARISGTSGGCTANLNSTSISSTKSSQSRKFIMLTFLSLFLGLVLAMKTRKKSLFRNN